MAQTKLKGWNHTLVCEVCRASGCWWDHKFRDKCVIWCSHCGTNGHHISFCYNLNFCNLCGKDGHNPYRCWTYSTIQKWIDRAKELDRCVSCLTPWKLAAFEFSGRIICRPCGQGIKWLDPECESKESQTEDTYLVQECQK